MNVASAATPTSTSSMRLAGADRYETAIELAEAWDSAGGTPTNVVVTSGENWPDALAAASLAGEKSGPIVLTRSGSLPQTTRDWLLLNRSTVSTVYVVGGPSAVSTSVVSEIEQVLETTDTVIRVSGDTRYGTMQAVAEVSGVLDAADTLLLVSGNGYADALSAAAYSASGGFPILLTPSDRLGSEARSVVESWLSLNAGTPGVDREVVIIGGETAVSERVKDDLLEMGVPFANIRRIGGYDRYSTSAEFNKYLLEASSGSFAGERLALVRGDDFADALAASAFLALPDVNGNRVHTLLTSSEFLSLPAARLVNDLSRLRAGSATDAATNQLQELWVIGGVNAVPDAIKSDLMQEAGAMVDIAPVMECNEGSTSVTLTFRDELTAEDATISVTDFSSSTVAVTGVSFTPPSRVVTATVSALQGGSELAFLGKGESAGRRLLSASCTVVDDTTSPTLTIDARPGATDFTVTASEMLSPGSFTAGDISGVTVSSGPNLIPGTNTYVLTASSTISAGAEINIPPAAVTDIAGNPNPAYAFTTSLSAETVRPVVNSFSLSCEATSDAAVVLGSAPNTLTLSATRPYKPGGEGNGYELRLVNQRGALVPVVEYRWTENLIVVTLDRMYHTTRDVFVAFREEGGLPDAWALTLGGTGLFPEADFDTSPNLTSGGTESCLLTGLASEPLQAGAFFSAVSVNGASASLGASAASAQGGTSFSVEIVNLPANPEGTIIATVSGMTDLVGNDAEVVVYTP